MTLEEVKKYLKIDYEDDDDILSELLVVSEEYINSCVGTGYKSDEKAMKLFNLLQKKLTYDMYEKRGTEIANNTKKDIIVTTILDKLSNYSEVE
ncbi:head-tail connector protein [Clostridium tertium]|uniref:head-tail connector protein n=1 Tax=Clostridium TaxID=1485 RepID=UPI00115B5F02|nr:MULTISPECIES: head-tail connector protein [Clostridium]MDB1935137.1 head-tail connector protein [Clostridium tertium]MDB1938408.1 head-tail connector protein [Clostridium tertium]MDB1947618.1 head-tail connector protein [Clostridium tertium]MDB1956026.1 head-tail connector protein [Clostridium tertium]MDB1959021.1 head-tail connector protein [Clostridium tertium]